MPVGAKQWASQCPIALLPLIGIIPKRTIGFGMTERRSIRVLAFLVVISSLLLTGCSSGKSKEAAVEALNKSWRREDVMLFVFVGRVSERCTPIVGLEKDGDLTKMTNFRAAQKAGLITITPDGTGFWKVEVVNPSPKLIALLNKVPHTVKDGCDWVAYSFSVGSKVVSEIANIHEITGEKAEAEYTWKWALTPAGVKLVDKLSQPELIQVNANLEDLHHHYRPDPTFNLADMVESSTPRPGKKMLKKSGDGWVLDE